jgi:hypothetical protein
VCGCTAVSWSRCGVEVARAERGIDAEWGVCGVEEMVASWLG